MSDLGEFELRLLRAIAGLEPALPWGGAVGQALEVLRGRGLIELVERKWSVSEKGRQLVAEVKP